VDSGGLDGSTDSSRRQLKYQTNSFSVTSVTSQLCTVCWFKLSAQAFGLNTQTLNKTKCYKSHERCNLSVLKHQYGWFLWAIFSTKPVRGGSLYRISPFSDDFLNLFSGLLPSFIGKLTLEEYKTPACCISSQHSGVTHNLKSNSWVFGYAMRQAELYAQKWALTLETEGHIQREYIYFISLCWYTARANGDIRRIVCQKSSRPHFTTLFGIHTNRPIYLKEQG